MQLRSILVLWVSISVIVLGSSVPAQSAESPDIKQVTCTGEVINEQGEEIKLKQPYVIEDLCIGCGICETKCPVPGTSAIIVTSAGESRNPDHALPTSEGGYGAGSPYGV